MKEKQNHDLDALESLMTESKNPRRPKPHGKQMLKATLVFGFLFGLLGGVVGSLFLVPWFEQNFLPAGQREPEAISERQIILDEDSAIVSATEAVNPAVVSIVVTKDLPAFQQFASPFGEFFFTIPSDGTERRQVGAGTGFIVSNDGMIVTNKHVVDDPEAEYTVINKDGESFSVIVLATDPFNDLAVIKIEATGLPVVELGDSDLLKLGQRVIAIGNALGRFQNTVTSGVVSGTGRSLTTSGGAQTDRLSEVIQTDAAINPGNSGGPLLNLSGEVIGVNTAISQGAEGLGFAIPINQVKKVINDVSEFGKVLRPLLGVRYTIVTPVAAEAGGLQRDFGALIISGDQPDQAAILTGSPAEEIGLLEGDIILELDGKKITIDNQLADVLRNYSPNDRVVLKVFRDDAELILTAILGEAI